VRKAPAEGPAVSSSQADREAAKKKQALVRKLEREEEAILTDLDALDVERAALEAQMADPAVYSDGPRAKKVQADLTANLAQQEALQEKWVAVAEELEKAKA
jgi:hypothetical protein